ncbi:hypothetical protein [Sphingopyxis sp. MG]|uniref:hypothetical protein n=1 Tax=Sphingopyxis sp. MG TaxID=1866325 RepID=UPI00269E4383|nr:hypothetical protein [Sphingopyxis sp. MG]
MTDPVMQPLPAIMETGTSVPPQILLGNHLKALKLPTFAREYEKVAMEAAGSRTDYPGYLLRLCELERGLSGFPCVAGHNGQQGVPLCHDAKNLPYRMSFSISFWRAALPVPPSSRAVCSIR